MARILIIEDDTYLNDAYRMLLEKEGHQVTVAFNGKEGLDKLKGANPEVILLDLLMPVMGGLDFLRQYKPDPKADHSPKIVILTNLDQDKEIQEVMSLGAYKYVIKAHTSPKQLAIHVNHLINRNIDKKPDENE